MPTSGATNPTTGATKPTSGATKPTSRATGGGNVDANVGRLDGGQMAAIVVPVMIVVLIIVVVIVIAVAVVAVYRLRRCDMRLYHSLFPSLCTVSPHYLSLLLTYLTPAPPFPHLCTLTCTPLPSPILTVQDTFLSFPFNMLPY